VSVHEGNGHTLGERGGEQAHTLSIGEMPTHTHLVQASSAPGTAVNPANTVLAAASNVYRQADNLTALNAASVTNVGGSQAHLNMQPFLALNFCIALQGIFPSPN
jgi:microcystin-dependent protein